MIESHDPQVLAEMSKLRDIAPPKRMQYITHTVIMGHCTCCDRLFSSRYWEPEFALVMVSELILDGREADAQAFLAELDNTVTNCKLVRAFRGPDRDGYR